MPYSSNYRYARKEEQYETTNNQSLFTYTPVDAIDFAGKIFVLTGFGADDEQAMTANIQAKGGVVKSSVVLSTAYLIAKPLCQEERVQ